MMTEEELIRDAVSKMTLPKEVKSVDFSFSEDATGMPAVWINLLVAEDFKPSAAKVNKLSDVGAGRGGDQAGLQQQGQQQAVALGTRDSFGSPVGCATRVILMR